MANFATAYEETANNEGGYANDKDDKGGETFKGIARQFETNWPGWLIVDKLKQQPDFPNNLSLSSDLQKLVLTKYKTNYWDALNLDFIKHQKVANELFDTAVNMGVGRAALFFQRVLNVMNRKGTLFQDLKLDAQVGPKTVGVFNGLTMQDKEYVWRLLNCLQGEKYISICEANPTQEKFMRSWASRVF